MHIALQMEWWWWLSLLPLLWTTAPRTWIPGELVNAAMMNSLRDLFRSFEGGDALMKRVKLLDVNGQQSALLSTTGNAAIANFGGTPYISMDGAWWVSLGSISNIGPHDVFISARGMRPLPGYASLPLAEVYMPSTTYSYVSVIPFREASPNPGGYEGAYFELAFPRNWDLGNLLWSLYFFTIAGGSGNVLWYIQAAGFSDGESLNADMANLGSVAAPVAGAYVLTITAPVAVAPPATSAKDDCSRIAVLRHGIAAEDTYADGAYLIGMKLTFQTNKATSD
jgi:hypothetical protein